jgi:hypothetical protein
MNKIENPILKEKKSYSIVLKSKFPVDFLVKSQAKEKDK